MGSGRDGMNGDDWQKKRPTLVGKGGCTENISPLRRMWRVGVLLTILNTLDSNSTNSPDNLR